MHMKILRRSLLGWAGLPLGMAISGCVADYPAGRVLDVWNIEASQSNSSVTLNVTVRARNNLEPGGFHNVEVVGFSKSGDSICSEYVGDLAVGVESSQQTIALECSTRPHIVGIVADETPCDENTYIEFRGYNASNNVWKLMEWRCGENPF